MSDVERRQSDELEQREREQREREERDSNEPRQTVRRMAEDQPDVGPFYPSGMSGPEAALAGATADLSDRDLEHIEAVRAGHDVEDPDEDDDE